MSSLTHAHPRRHAATLHRSTAKRQKSQRTSACVLLCALHQSRARRRAWPAAHCLQSARASLKRTRAPFLVCLCGFAVWGFATRAHAAHLAPIDPPVPAPARVPLMTTYPSLTQVCVMLCEQGGGALRRVAGQLGAARGPHARERRQAAQGRQVTHACLARAPSIKEQCMCL